MCQNKVAERIQKVLARHGFGSRRACEELITKERVKVNGVVAILGGRIDVARDELRVDDVVIGVSPELVYYLLNKPKGVISTVDDPQQRSTVVDLVPPLPRVFPVGRLDADTEGLILLTNDGDLAYRLTHPSFGVEKEYLAQLDSRPSRGALRQLRQGVDLADGTTAPAKVSLLDDRILKIVIHEGRNRQIRRMCEALGHRVLLLVRTRIGPLTDHRLSVAHWRSLEPLEIRQLQSLSWAR